MLRRSFLQSLVKTAAGLYLAPDALELLLEPRRKLWPGWTPTPGVSLLRYLRSVTVNAEGMISVVASTEDADGRYNIVSVTGRGPGLRIGDHRIRYDGQAVSLVATPVGEPERTVLLFGRWPRSFAEWYAVPGDYIALAGHAPPDAVSFYKRDLHWKAGAGAA